MSAIEFLAGLVVVLLTLRDAFETVVLPRTVQRRFRLTRLMVRTTWTPLVAFSRLPIGSDRRDSLFAMYGPLILLFLLAAWAVLLIVGFGLMFHAVSDLGTARGVHEPSFGAATYFSGSSFFTLGLGDVRPVNSASRVLVVVEAGTGFGFLAMVIGYLPIFYQAFSRREIAISLLDARAGSPPTAVELIRRNGEKVATEVLANWEGWASELLESHLSYPVLAYFRSQHEKQSWLAALVVILDTSSLIMSGVDGMAPQQARFTFAMARHALVDLTQIFFAEPEAPVPDRLSHEDFVTVSALLASYGFTMLSEDAEQTLAGLRHGYEPMAYALSQRLLLEIPPWLRPPGAEDDWQSSPWDSMLPI